MNRLPRHPKLVASRNLSSDLWDLTELVKIMNLEITARENCECNSDHIGKNDNFMSKDFCKSLQNLAICNNRDKKETSESTNVKHSSAEKDFVL